MLRDSARLLGASAAAASFPVAATAQPNRPPDPRAFPAGFLWGSATASYQVEGAIHEDGRGPSIWDTFSHTPGKTFQGDTGDVADDFFHRYPEDIKLMQQLGLKAFRFSIAWSRIFPTGAGAPNPKGLDFYNRLVDALLAANIQPFCTLFHWDLPQALEDKGGWQNRATSEAFADYAAYIAKHLSDRIQHFMTLNEMSSFVEIGYKDGRHAPGLRLGPAAPKFTPADMKAIGSPLDFVGINCYAPEFVRADASEQGYAVVPRPKSYPHMASDWLAIGPEGLYWGPKLVAELWSPKAIFITENGTSSDDIPTADGLVLDTDRVMFLRNYLTQLQRVVGEGAPVRGYFLWSLLDNYEWADGYAKRFGIVYVDFKTQKRTPKLSAQFYKATIARNIVA